MLQWLYSLLCFKQRFDANSWLEVDLGESTVVSGLITQGDEFSVIWRVTEYKVKYKKMSSSDYEDVKDNNGAIQVHTHLLAA